MIKKIIFLLLFIAIKIESSIEIKNESNSIPNLSVTVYEKRLCGRGKQIKFDPRELHVDKRYLIEFYINGAHFEYTTKKDFNYIFSIKNDGIYLEDSWRNDLNGDDGLFLSSDPIKLFTYNY